MSPHMKKIRNIRKFFRKGLHIEFEKADTLNRTDWFERANEKYGECMKAHAVGVGSVFDMSNYWNWYKQKSIEVGWQQIDSGKLQVGSNF